MITHWDEEPCSHQSAGRRNNADVAYATKKVFGGAPNSEMLHIRHPVKVKAHQAVAVAAPQSCAASTCSPQELKAQPFLDKDVLGALPHQSSADPQTCSGDTQAPPIYICETSGKAQTAAPWFWVAAALLVSRRLLAGNLARGRAASAPRRSRDSELAAEAPSLPSDSSGTMVLTESLEATRPNLHSFEHFTATEASALPASSSLCCKAISPMFARELKANCDAMGSFEISPTLLSLLSSLGRSNTLPNRCSWKLTSKSVSMS